jgi:hypothetical protein
MSFDSISFGEFCRVNVDKFARFAAREFADQFGRAVRSANQIFDINAALEMMARFGRKFQLARSLADRFAVEIGDFQQNVGRVLR